MQANCNAWLVLVRTVHVGATKVTEEKSSNLIEVTMEAQNIATWAYFKIAVSWEKKTCVEEKLNKELTEVGERGMQASEIDTAM